MSAGGALIGYARVSTPDQDLDMQIAALEQAGCVRIFSDVASGAKAARPGLDEALAYLRPADTLAVWKLDRLGRSVIHLVHVLDDLRRRGVDLRVTTDPAMDTSTPGGKLLFHLVAAVAEFERELIRERTITGLKAAKARGRKGGKRPVVTPAILARAQKMLAASDSPMSVREIAGALGVGKTALYNALREINSNH